MDKDNALFEAATNTIFEGLPINNTRVFLEMDYRNDVQFAVGLIGHAINIAEAKEYFIVLNEREEWNKIYIDLTEILNQSGFNQYQVTMTAVIPFENGDFVQDEGNLYFDNMKIVHFEQ